MSSRPGANHATVTKNSTTTTTTTPTSTEPLKHYLEPDEYNEIPLWLVPCHIVAAIFQYMQSFVLFAFSKEVETRSPLYTNYRGNYNLLSDDFGTPTPVQWGKASLTIVSALTVLIAAVMHTVAVLPCWRTKYEEYLKRNQSPYRWLEYMVSASIMRAQVAMIAGVTDLHLLFCIWALSACCINFGRVHEPLNSRALVQGTPQKLIGLYLSFACHFCSWAIIFCYFVTGIARGDPPGYVGTILVSLFLLDGCFAVNFVLQWFKIGYFKDYLFGEFAFIMLSFTAKTFLAWISYGAASSTKLQE
jgi:hypothetical protein